MSQKQYLRMLDKEMEKLNKTIDIKIMKGLDYRKEARNHRLMLRRMRYLTGQSFTKRMVHLFFRKDINIYA